MRSTSQKCDMHCSGRIAATSKSLAHADATFLDVTIHGLIHQTCSISDYTANWLLLL